MLLVASNPTIQAVPNKFKTQALGLPPIHLIRLIAVHLDADERTPSPRLPILYVEVIWIHGRFRAVHPERRAPAIHVRDGSRAAHEALQREGAGADLPEWLVGPRETNAAVKDAKLVGRLGGVLAEEVVVVHPAAYGCPGPRGRGVVCGAVQSSNVRFVLKREIPLHKRLLGRSLRQSPATYSSFSRRWKYDAMPPTAGSLSV